MNACLSPCSDFLVIASACGIAFFLLLLGWYGQKYVPTCRCPVPAKCPHRKKGK